MPRVRYVIFFENLSTLIFLINVGPTFTDFEKFHPPQKKSTLHVYWFLRFFPPFTPRLLELCISFFLQNPTLHVYANLHI